MTLRITEKEQENPPLQRQKRTPSRGSPGLIRRKNDQMIPAPFYQAMTMEMQRTITKEKKGQIVGQIFIYVLAIVVMGAILIFGYNAIADFRSKSSQVSTIRIQSDVSSALESLSSFMCLPSW